MGDVEKIVNQSPVVLLIKGTPTSPQCGFTRKIINLFTQNKVEFTTFNVKEILKTPFCEEIKKYSKWPTFPQVFVKGEFVGGLDVSKELFSTGELQKKIQEKCPENIDSNPSISIFIRLENNQVLEYKFPTNTKLLDIHRILKLEEQCGFVEPLENLFFVGEGLKVKLGDLNGEKISLIVKREEKTPPRIKELVGVGLVTGFLFIIIKKFKLF